MVKKSRTGPSTAPPSKDTYHLKLTFFLSLTALPIIYLFNSGFTWIEDSARPFWMMASGFILLGGICGITYVASSFKDWVYFGMSLFAFTAVIDMIVPLECLGLVDSFMSEYLKMGEPYLLSPWGSAISCFDGTGFYIMYLVIVYLHTNKLNWRSVGLYWAAAILNAMLILMTGIFTGKHAATLCTLLNIPYILFPIFVVFWIFRTQEQSSWNPIKKSGVYVKFYDVALGVGLLGSMWIIAAKTLAVLGSEQRLVMETVKSEPALLYADPAPFYSIQVLAFYFYVIPVQIASFYYLCRAEKPQFLWDLTVALAGAMLQAQFSYIMSSLDPTTPEPYRADWTNTQFWITNLTIVIIPHVFLIRLHLHKVSEKKGN